MITQKTFATSVAVGLTFFASPRRAGAEGDVTKEQCIAANESAASLQKANKLAAARAQLRICVVAACPRLVRDDCAAQLDAVEKAMPTLVFAAKGPDGTDVAAVTVTVDGTPLTERLDGSGLEVDPGEHNFEFTTAGYPTVSKRIVVREGVKGRAEAIQFGTVAAMMADALPARLVVGTERNATIIIDGSVKASSRYDGRLSPGPHEIRVTKPGKLPSKTNVDLRGGETRSIDVALEEESRKSLLPWLIGGGVVVAAAAVVGGILLSAPEDKAGPPPTGKLGSVTLGSSGR